MNNSDQEIYDYLLKHEKITEKEYQEICSLFGKERISKFLNNINDNIDQEQIDSFLKKYQVLFDEVYEQKSEDSKASINAKSSGFSQDPVLAYINDIRNIKQLTAKEANELFIKLENLRQNIKILNIINDKELKIDFPTILMSIKDERQIKSLIKLYKANYNSSNDEKYEKTINSEHDRQIIKKYLELYNKNNRPLSKKELISQFKEIDFHNYKLIEENEFDYQIDMLIELLNTVKRIEYSNLKLVISVARRYSQKNVQLLDLIQEGNIEGLRKAILKFDVKKGYRFSTYATYWIMQAVTRFIKCQANTIRKPVHLEEKIFKYKKHYNILSMELGRTPTMKEIALSMDMTVEQCSDLEKYALEPKSLDSLVGEQEDQPLWEFLITDTCEETIEEQYEKNALKADIDKILSRLNPREAEVIRHRFGLNDAEILTLNEIGEKYNVSRERIRQIEKKALRKIKNYSRLLQDYNK